MRGLLLFIMLSITHIVVAGTDTDLGVVGQTYDIAEPDLLDHFYTKLNAAKDSGELAKIESEMKERATAYANRPRGVALPRTKVNKVSYFDPSVNFTQSIKDHEGNVLWPAGTRVNALDYMTMSQQWIFFNGDDPDQAAWAQAYANRYPEQVLLILTQGAVIELMNAWDKRIYFDQGGKLVKRFGIETLPSVVSQSGKRLRIDAIVPEIITHD